ncbi:guanine deaminase [Amphritea sp. 2_MG-2023]|jgi:guanine deaminase|uniref:guanine deaminase n=1 Tax=Amphritea TaxID=515417 RepID=UPI001C06A9AE|nr:MULTISPECIES: guanine deaminase [Amphritea]MBU2965315.1 guanine deaminase [Amphritea atlantica]MDO6420178.1 guanine deaminase [Amphritea sp. 2_MG-2023]MDX2424244.1 guanine deaminase [Amphritea sp.]
MTQSAITAYRAAILDSLGDPSEVGIENSYRYFDDGLMVVENGQITALGEASELLSTLPADIRIQQYTDALIIPGFIDTHIHYPQTGMIASYGEQLLDWLENYTFPAEQKFADPQHAAEVSDIFVNELLRNGTTTALVFGTVHPQSVDAFFQAAEQRNLRMIAGKVMMDRNAPEALTDTPDSSYTDSKALIERWHGKGRLHYAVTPRFAPTSTPEQLSLAGKLLQEYDGLYMHTHLSENKSEIEWVKELFPEQKGYLDVYDHHQLLGERSVFAHGVHLCDEECQRLADTDSAIAFCPTSNLFLGSGLFNLPQAEAFKINVGMGTDVGAGTSFSMLQTINEAYKVMQLQGKKLHPFKSFYLATLGGAKALQLADKIGNLEPGTEADFVVLDYNATPLMKYRMAQTQTLEERLFVMMTLGDDRAVKKTYAMGEPVYSRD